MTLSDFILRLDVKSGSNGQYMAKCPAHPDSKPSLSVSVGKDRRIVKPGLEWLWTNFLQPIAEWTGGMIVDVIEGICSELTRVSDWIGENQKLVEDIAIAIGSFAAAWVLVNTAVEIWNGLGAVAAAVTTGFGAAVSFLTSPIGIITMAIGALIAVVALLVKNWDKVKEVASNCWDKVKEVWGKVADWFTEHIIDPISNGFKSFVNGLLGFVESFVNFFIRGINAIIGAINKLSVTVPDWVPLIGGKKFGFNIPTITELSLPRLATGAVIPPNREFMAVLGDQKTGTNIEAPEALIRKIVREETAGMGGETVLNNVVELDGEVIYRNQKKVSKRHGVSLVTV